MKVYIFALALLALFAAAYAVLECPAEDGDYAVSTANPADCATFYKCLDGQSVLIPCPSGLEYNSELGVCDWPENADCVVSAAQE